MRTLLLKLGVCLVACVATGLAVAADEAPPDRKGLEQQVFTTLRDVINRGADLYNNGDPAACYHLYQGSLLTVRPLLDHRPDLQKSMETGMADAARNPDMRRRAWALRYVLDDVRAQVGGKGAPVAKGGKDDPIPPPKARALWDRLGGEAAVAKVVDDFVAIAAEDEKVNFTRDGKFKPDDKAIAELKKQLIAFVSVATGGPLKYTGRSMKEIHKGMGITNEEFDAAAADLVKALAKNGAKEDDIDALIKIVDTTRKDIVEVKKEDKPKEKDKDDKKDDKEKDKKDDKEKDKEKDKKDDDK